VAYGAALERRFTRKGIEGSNPSLSATKRTGSRYVPVFFVFSGIAQSVTIRLSMFMLDLMRWWYGAGWAGVLTANKKRLGKLADMFSIAILLRTLFSPWKRIVTYPGASIDAKMRAFGDNIVSRCIGFTVRAFVLLSAGFIFVCLILLEVLEIVLWPLIPLGGVGLIVKGFL
jgi:hypothetical protein